jgi:hypothetical protein
MAGKAVSKVVGAAVGRNRRAAVLLLVKIGPTRRQPIVFFLMSESKKIRFLAGNFQSTRHRFSVTNPDSPVLILHDTTESTYARTDVESIGILHKSFTGKMKRGASTSLQYLWNPDVFELGYHYGGTSAWSDRNQSLDKR